MENFNIQSKIDDVEIELRALAAEVKNNADINLDEVRAKKAELEEKRANLVKELAQAQAPVIDTNDEKTMWRSIAEAMIEKRTVNLAGTGVVNTLRELVKKVVSNTDVLEGVRFFYGPNAATKIPVWGTQLKADFVSEGSTGTPKSNTAGVTSIDACEILSSLPVSDMMLELGAASLAAELPGLFEEAIADLLADGMCNGKSITVGSDTVVAMVGIFGVTGTAYTAGALMVKLGEFARNLKSKKYRDPFIYMSNVVYSKFLSDNSTDETTKIYKEGLIRDKMIEGVKIKLTDYAVSTGSGESGAWADGDVIAVGMDASNYAIGMAGQLKIKQKETASATYSTFDATAYAGGKPIINSDVHQFKIDV